MARVSTCLNFPGTTERAFEFYRALFGGSLTVRFGTRWMFNCASQA